MSLIEHNQPFSEPISLKRRTPDPKITARVAAAIELMVEQGLQFDQAAKTVGLHVRAMRKALDKPHVLKYMKERKYVFRESISAANIFTLADVRDNSGNAIARVQAVKALEQIGDADPVGTKQQPPGFALVIVNTSAVTQAVPKIIEHNDK